VRKLCFRFVWRELCSRSLLPCCTSNVNSPPRSRGGDSRGFVNPKKATVRIRQPTGDLFLHTLYRLPPTVLRREIHAAQEVLKARVGAQGVETRVCIDIGHVGIALFEASLKPFQGTLPFALALHIRVGRAGRQAHLPPEALHERLPPGVSPETDGSGFVPIAHDQVRGPLFKRLVEKPESLVHSTQP